MSIGNLYIFKATLEESIEWAIVKRHTDSSDLWFLVPYDQYDYTNMVGTWDVLAQAKSCYPDVLIDEGVLRCAYGIWMRTDDINRLGEQSGIISQEYIEAAQLRLANMVNGNETNLVIKQASKFYFKSEVDDDPDYDAWTLELAKAGNRLEDLCDDLRCSDR